MEFRIDATLPATPARLWDIFFDVHRVAALIPGCENVAEVAPLQEFSAVMKQKIGPFKLEVPTRILIESHAVERQVVLAASGTDKFTGTTIDVRMKVDFEPLQEADDTECRLVIDANMNVAGRLASLGFPIVRKRSEELFGEFERRLREELTGAGLAATAADLAPTSGDEQAKPRALPPPAGAPTLGPIQVEHRSGPAPIPRTGRTELVLLWPRVGISTAVAVAVAHGAVAFGQSPWWWLVAPLLGVAAGLGRRQD